MEPFHLSTHVDRAPTQRHYNHRWTEVQCHAVRGCAYTIAPPLQSIAAAGGNGAIAITTTPTCLDCSE